MRIGLRKDGYAQSDSWGYRWNRKIVPSVAWKMKIGGVGQGNLNLSLVKHGDEGSREVCPTNVQALMENKKLLIHISLTTSLVKETKSKRNKKDNVQKINLKI